MNEWLIQNWRAHEVGKAQFSRSKDYHGALGRVVSEVAEPESKDHVSEADRLVREGVAVPRC